MSDVLDLPVIEPDLIDAPPKARTEVAVAAAAALDLTKVDLTDVALAQFGQWRKKVDETKANVSTLVLDLSNQSKIDDAKSLRQRLFNAPRADARKVSKELKSKLASVSKAIGAEEALIVAAYDEAEKPLTQQIDIAQKKLDDEKEAARQAEAARLQTLRERVDATLAPWVDRCRIDGITAERIAVGIDMLKGAPMPDWAADVAAYWDLSKQDTLQTMSTLRGIAEASEVAAKLEAQRIENERIAAELAEKQRLVDEQATELARQQQDIEAARLQRAASSAPTEARGTADTPRADEREAAPVNTQQDSQHVLKAEASGPDATDRESPAHASPVGGPMGAGQPAAAGPAEEPITPDAEESGSSPADAPAAVDAPRMCASSEAEAAEALPSGDEGTGAHAEVSAPEPAGPDDTPLETSEREARDVDLSAIARPAGPPTLKLGTICERLSPISITAAGLAEFGIHHSATDKAAKLYHESEWPSICSALVAHISAKVAA